jgi:hypothetical protein
MKCYLSLIAFFVLLVSRITAASFHNLDFEQASGPFYPYQPIPVSTALPYWTVTGAWPADGSVYFNSYALDVPDVELLSPGLQGNYAVFLENIAGNQEVSISQTGTVPSFTNSHPTCSVRFLCSVFWTSDLDILDGVYMTLDGNAIPLYPTSIDGELSGNIPQILRGHAAELKIGFRPVTGLVGDAVVIDSVYFSDVAVVPEPSTIALLLAASLGGLLWWRRRA